jgi:uncharacterized membrane protein YphA (DoxX/SURF4 family)
MMLMSAFMYFTNPEVTKGFQKVGFPDYFRIELGIAKFLGAIALLLPLPGRFKEWAYFGFFITFVSALIAHISIGDPASKLGGVFMAIVLLIVSYVTYSRIAARKGTVITK